VSEVGRLKNTADLSSDRALSSSSSTSSSYIYEGRSKSSQPNVEI
jgi:hypothetical protein